MTPKAYNWQQYLKRRPRTVAEWKTAALAAGEWPTCACGQLDSRIDRHVCGAPIDDRLYNLGVDFYNAVDRCDWDGSCEIFHKIEAREAELLAKLKP